MLQAPYAISLGSFWSYHFKKKKPSVFVGVKYSQQDLSFQCNDDSNKKRTMNFEYRIIKCALSYLGIYQRYVYVSIWSVLSFLLTTSQPFIVS